MNHIIRKAGGNLHFIIPRHIARAYALSEGDNVVWDLQPDGIKVTFCRVVQVEPRTLVTQEKITAQSATQPE
jgi:antitoxin component of MazEF toxin-antitoxin module